MMKDQTLYREYHEVIKALNRIQKERDIAVDALHLVVQDSNPFIAQKAIEHIEELRSRE